MGHAHAYTGRGWGGIRKSEARIRTKNVTDPERCRKVSRYWDTQAALPVPKCTDPDPDPGNALCL
jgi:hypothetical protein